ncbi:NAD(P)/FAD-dependent oxidoreductase [Limnoraphis robusta Tam1]|uniref:NAD(P)/FAD-dependent oxidoreductase n=1 Tax=Limnoraphis robusta CCNP1315 TaxID=3110306 RepID=A0ABU5TX02_9CYAN|nr:NAD(P)/FAD-dependent oxidoreductase [Limnoraphis robusta]MEA5519431.1 NAD(P)/FAD-dependent oxidoreductase [Limnoraphis robusta CCNP1315]MEA5539972.1 NAD(P)/FAD-dependent oxidoreductase [Limnoraphis robusta Tam1]MEA5549113.1 NAD(P)/FAD-dependent oxidoreductase [Limnoraphis robusta CCNP1324]
MTEQPTRICILGGGFGGLYTALRLNELPWRKSEQPEITLVDSRDRFLFSPFLYELLTGELQTWEIAPPFEQLLQNTNIRFCQQVVTAIDIEAKEVQLSEGEALTFDYLVLAMGGETPLDIVPGAAEYAIPFRSIEDAYRLEERLRLLEASDQDKIRIAIVGGGYSGVELACKLADRLQERGRLRLIERDDRILRSSPNFNREAAQRALQQRGVWVDLETTVQSIEASTMALEYRQQVDPIPVDLVLWTVGTRISPIVQSLPLKHNKRGQVLTTTTLQAVEHSEIFALGDLADCKDAEGQQVPSTAQAAFQQADYAAWNIWASMTGRPLLPFRYQGLGEMMTLGTDDATLTGLGIKLEGQMAHLARRLIYLYRFPTLDHQVRVAFNWITRPLQDMISPPVR